MPLARHLSICVLSLCATSASAQLRAGEWVSYRDAYRAMVVFEKYGGAKNYLQSQLQVAPQDRSVSFDGLQLTLAGKTNQVNLPLDPLGRAAFPLLKAAYDENVALLLSRKIGSFTVRPRVSIALQADGLYEDSELRAACEQALGFARYGDGSLRSRQCGGVRFVFAKRAGEAGVRLHRQDGSDSALPVVSGTAFGGDGDDGFPTVLYRFNGAERGQLVTANPPLAIVPVFD
ncbi:hypothetical protein G4G28_07655 [Massilia sp. Dwa41.01b]|uniref:hypothetical protein n=1 Tax=Massilia sp. Dwa41.01b TaxID=2709302 RepID=UPI00160440F9|nr:hypothetical protein [Massilia sp. Dwa41.01b]QNA88403.1 hypothetical protein G4G28_07655 [Massilia sp. Dwa41.01b]